MKARALIDGAPFDPETVKAIGEAFDQASARINSIFGNDPDAVEAARIRFAEAILSVAIEGNTDVGDLKNRPLAVPNDGDQDRHDVQNHCTYLQQVRRDVPCASSRQSV